MAPQPVAEARGGTADELQEVQITPRYIGPGAEAANARLDRNPINIIRSGSDVSPDEVSAAANTPDLSGIETVVSTAPKWRTGERIIFQDLMTAALISGRDFNEDYASAQAQDIYRANIRRQADNALISGFTPIGQLPLVAEGIVNLGGKALSGLGGLLGLGRGLDVAAAAQENTQRSLQVNWHSPFYDELGQAFAPELNRLTAGLEDTIGVGPTIALGSLVEFGLDASVVLGGGSVVRGVAPRAFDTPLWGASRDGQFLGNQLGAVGDDLSRLRRLTPTQALRDAVNPPGEKFDPVYGYQVDRLEADHIVPLDELKRMPGFSQLTFKDQVEVANLPENFMGLGKPTNASKGATPVAQWPGHRELGPIDPSVREMLLQRDAAARTALEREIEKRLKNGQ